MVDNGFKLAGSQAIATYIARTRNLADHWYPANILDRTKIDDFLHWFHLSIRYAATIFFETYLRPKLPEGAIVGDASPDMQKIRFKEATNMLKNSLNHLEKILE